MSDETARELEKISDAIKKEDGDWRQRSIRYGERTKQFDATATPGVMQQCADSYRSPITDPNFPEWMRSRRKAEAAYCQAWADKKRRS